MHKAFAVTISVLIALMISLLPMPSWAIWLQPAWVLMVLIYWTMTSPYRVGVGVAWMTGIIMDLLTGSVLGEHALAFTLVIYFVSKMAIRLNMYPMLQQGLTIFILVFLYQFTLFCIQGFIGELPQSQLYWLS